MQTPPHGIDPAGHAHVPLAQTRPPVHAFPHAPQFVPLIDTFTQLVPHRRSPAAQVATQAPLLHAMFAAQATPHAPQLPLLERVSTHVPLHSVVPFGHTHVPLTHA